MPNVLPAEGKVGQARALAVGSAALGKGSVAPLATRITHTPGHKAKQLVLKLQGVRLVCILIGL